MTALTKEDADLTQQIFDAVREGDLSSLDRFISENASACPHLLGLGFLFACREERLEVIRKMLDHVNPNTRTADGGTGLTLAASGRNPQVVSLLLDRGCDPNLVDNIGRTALHWAAINGRDANIRILLKCGVAVNAPDKNQWTPLMHAATRNFALVVHQLVHAGADTMKSNSVRMCALHLAVQYDCAQVVKTLIPFYSSLDPPNRWNETPLFIGVTRQNPEIVNVLLATKRVDLTIRTNRLGHFGPLEMAAKQGQLEMVRLLLEHGCSPDPRPCAGSGEKAGARMPLSALMYAAENEDPEMVELLLKAGADPNWCHPTHQRERFLGPLHMVARSRPQATPRSELVMEQLLGAGARPDGPYFGRPGAEDSPTPLVLAASMDNLKASRILLRHGAKPDAPFPRKAPEILRLLSPEGKGWSFEDTDELKLVKEFKSYIFNMPHRKVLSLVSDRGGDESLRKGIINMFREFKPNDFDPSIDLSPTSPYYRLLKNYFMDVLLESDFCDRPALVFNKLKLLPKPLVYTVMRDEMLVARAITSGNLYTLGVLVHGLVDFSRPFTTLYPKDPVEFAVFADNLPGALLIAMAGGSLRSISSFHMLQYIPKVLQTSTELEGEESESLAQTLMRWSTRVRPLKELCRQTIRSRIRLQAFFTHPDDWQDLPLPLPDPLKVYISILCDKESKMMFDFLLRVQGV